VEKIRSLAKSATELFSRGVVEASEFLHGKLLEGAPCDRTPPPCARVAQPDAPGAEIRHMSLDDLMPLIRAVRRPAPGAAAHAPHSPPRRQCGHYLSLTSIAETHHMIRMNRQHSTWSMSHDTAFAALLASGTSPEDLHAAVAGQRVEIVLTAHPTQVNRRTLQYKHMKIAAVLEKNDRPDLAPDERDGLLEELVRELLSLWQTDELRRRKPTPLDEARWGLHIV